MSDVEKAISQALHEVKHKIHDRAVDPRIKGVDPYVTVKTVDAIIANCLAKYSADGRKRNIWYNLDAFCCKNNIRGP